MAKEIQDNGNKGNSPSIKKNTIYSAVKTVASVVFPLITFPYISRVLLPNNIGKVNFSASIVSYFSLFASLGITTYAVRECSQARDNKEKLADTASQIYTINIITTCIAYAALFLTLLCFQRLRDYRLLIVIQSITIVATTLGADWLNSAMEDFRYITIRSVTFQLVSLVLMFLFVHRPEDYIKYAVISLISSAGANIANIWYRRKYCAVRIIRNIRNGIEWKRHMMPILYLFVMLLVQTIFNSVDSTMLGLMIGDREVGIYSAAHKMSNIINQLVASLLWVIMPRMSFYFEKGDFTQINRLLQKVLSFNILLGIPIIAGGMLTAGDLVRVAAGAEFTESGTVLQILLIGFLFSLIGGNFLGNAILLPSRQEKYYMIVCCITAVVNVIGNYTFIPHFGARAAAGTTALCSLLILVLLLFRVDKRIRINGLASLIASPVIGGAGVVGVCWLCKSIDNLYARLGASFLGSCIVYGAILILLKNELVMELIGQLKRKINGI